jgi:sugar phosphate isomerase/epimerase
MENYETFYKGGFSSLSPDYGNFVGYRLSPGKIGSPTGIQTANQLNEVVERIREGVKNVELQPIQPDTFEQIPKEHFKEIRALMKLSGVKPSVHAPMIDPAGFGEKGYEGEFGREDAERRLFNVIEKSHELDPKGNIPIVIHSSSGVPGMEFKPRAGTKPGDKDRFEEWRGAIINKESGQMSKIEVDQKYYPTMQPDFEKGGTVMTPTEQINSSNATEWDAKLTELATFRKHANEIIGNAPLLLAEYKDKPLTKEVIGTMAPDQQAQYGKVRDAQIFLDNVRLNFSGAFNKAYKYGSEKQKEALKKLSTEYTEDLGKIKNTAWAPIEMERTLDKAIVGLKDITTKKYNQRTGEEIKGWDAPQLFASAEDFAMEKASQTFGNLATKSYDKFKDNAPVLAIENMYSGMAFSRAEDMKKLVEESRKVFVKNATKSRSDGGLGMSEGAAENHAKKTIGVTWDVGHLNIMRKHGFKKKDIVAETKKISKMVKHVHLTDNFGYSDSHLPPGMGNVPTKEILEQLEKAGALQNSRAIVEAGAFVQHFKKSPHPFTLSALGSPIYGAKMAPYWNQVANTQGNYFNFPLAQMPDKHFSLYGSGFSMLPEELGGQVPGTASRFSGTANA